MKELYETAQRVIDIDTYSARDYGETVETVSDLINTDPVTVISYLLDIIEDLQA